MDLAIPVLEPLGAIWLAALQMLALPLITALLVTNIAMGVLARIAPALNLFAVGFPVTLALGFIVLLLSLPYIGAAMESMFSRGFATLELVLRNAAG